MKTSVAALLTLVAVQFALTGGAALAQPGEEEAYIEEIIVSVRKKDESLQNVPISVTAFTEQNIQRQNIQGITDIALRTPGLNYEAYSSAGQSGAPVIRGLAPTDLGNREQNVATFLDGVYLPNQGMVDIGILDLARVEVVKGPQNALYGRNAFAGAINYVSSVPGDELRASLKGTVGSDEREDVILNLSGPIIADTLYGKAAYGTTEFDGTWENNHPNADVGINPGTNGNPGGWDNETLSLGLYYDSGQIQASVSYYHTDVSREVLPGYNILGGPYAMFNDLNCNIRAPFGPFGPSGNSLYCGELPVTPAAIAGDPRLPGVQIDPRNFGIQSETDVITARFRYEFENFAVNYLYGNTSFDAFGGGPVDRDQVVGTNVGPILRLSFPLIRSQVDARPLSDTETSSHELRLEYIGDGPLQWSGGLFYYDVDDDRRAGAFFAMPLDTTSLGDMIQAIASDNSLFEDEAFSVFASLDYEFNGRLSVRLEGRYTREDKKITRFTGAFGAPVLVPEQSEEFTFFTPKATLNYQLADDKLIYVSAARGVKAGGFNTAINPAQFDYDQEQNWTYEIGAKTEWLDGRMLFNAATFLIDWEDLQIAEAQFGPGVIMTSPTVIGNAGGAQSVGFEFSATWLLSNALQVSFGYALADAEYDSGVVNQSALRFVGCDGVICPVDASVGGNSLERQAKHQATLNLDYNQPLGYDFLGGNLEMFGNFNLSYQSKQHLSSLNAGDTGDRSLANVQLGVGNERWELSLWCRNCFDEEYVANSFFLPFANAYSPSLGEQRTYGLSLQLKYGYN